MLASKNIQSHSVNYGTVKSDVDTWQKELHAQQTNMIT